MAQYRKKVDIIEAYCWDGVSLMDAPDWVKELQMEFKLYYGYTDSENLHHLIVDLENETKYPLNPEEYLLNDNDGYLYTVSKEEFLEKYEPIPEPVTVPKAICTMDPKGKICECQYATGAMIKDCHFYESYA